MLKGVYCSFTVCATDGTVIGCIDVPGENGLKASSRNLKKKLFDECGIAYAVLSATELPPLEALRAAFLGDLSHADQRSRESVSPSQPALTEPAPTNPVVSVANPEAKVAGGAEVKIAVADTVAMAVVTDANQVSDGATPSETPVGIDMVAVAAARHSLQAKLDHNRKARIAKIESLNASMGIVDDNADHNFVVQWDDSFIMGEESGPAGNGKP